MADQRSGINGVFENLVDHHGFPTDFLAHVMELLLVRVLAFEVLPRRRDAVIIQAASNLGSVAAVQSLAEDTSDHVSRLRVYGKFVPNGGMQDVAVWRIAADILALLHHLDFCRCGLYGEVFAVYDAFQKAKDKPSFKAKHEAELVIFEAAQSTLLAMQGDEKLPSLKTLQAEQQRLLEEQQRLYDERARLKKEARMIDTLKANVDDFLKPNAERDQEQKRDNQRE